MKTAKIQNSYIMTRSSSLTYHVSTIPWYFTEPLRIPKVVKLITVNLMTINMQSSLKLNLKAKVDCKRELRDCPSPVVAISMRQKKSRQMQLLEYAILYFT